MAPTEADLDAVIVEAEVGIDFDGFVVDRDADGFAVETPAVSQSGLSEDACRDVLSSLEAYATNWRYWQEAVGGEGTARRAFLRWCERAPPDPTIVDGSAGTNDGGSGTSDDAAHLSVPDRYKALLDGIDRRWGQLRVTARLVDEDEPHGVRVYDLWHEADEGEDLADLQVYDDPRDAREITTTDEDGRYRPLKTAPTLVSGWAFTGLSGDELVETIEYVYPATIANWHLERQDRLDVDHWIETAQRQTGIYDIVDELPRTAVEWMAEACCVDSQCLRRREWHYDGDDELSVDGGDEAFPCREPCSLVIAAARTWAILESERERTWTLELTTSELNQLGTIVDAVADDRIDEIREADLNDGANRYRARYLRAKRFEDDDGLPARESDDDN